MSFDPATFSLFEESNFDAYDSGEDRYAMVLRAGLQQHGLELHDVLAVTQDLVLWAICRQGIFQGSLRGMLKKRAEIDPLIRYSQIDSISSEQSGPHTRKIVFSGQGRTLAQIDFRAGGPDNDPQSAAGHHRRILELARQAWSEARTPPG